MSTQPTHAPASFALQRDERTLACMPNCVTALAHADRALMNLPFDALRYQYALAVQIRIVERSLLASARFERAVCVLEQMSYGPFARRV